jgi:hypothetical protein
MKVKTTTILVIIMGLVFLTGCKEDEILEPPIDNETPNTNIADQNLMKAGDVISIDIRTPHPYPASEEGTQLVWEYRLNDPESLELRLHFKKFEVNGMFLKTSYEEELPPCEPQEPEVDYDEYDNVIGIGSVEQGLCGIITHKHTLQEIVNNYMEGDYVIIRNNKNGEILSILTGTTELMKNGPNHPTIVDGWSYIYATNDINIELYANENEDKWHGLEIDQYAQLTIGMGAE